MIKQTRYIIFFCAIITLTSSTHAIRLFTARAGTGLSIACTTYLNHADSSDFLWNMPIIGIASWVLYRMTPNSRLNRADGKLSSVHSWIRHGNLYPFEKLESPEEKAALYKKIDNHFVDEDFPYAAAKHTFCNSLSKIYDARDLAQKAKRDLDDPQDSLKRCAAIIERADEFEGKTTAILKTINEHKDYLAQMTSLNAKKTADEQTAALHSIQTTSMISAVNSSHRK